MSELRQSLERESSSRVAFLRQPSIARWAAIPPRLIVGYGFMVHGFAKLSRGLKSSPASCTLLACRRLISWHGSPFD